MIRTSLARNCVKAGQKSLHSPLRLPITARPSWPRSTPLYSTSTSTTTSTHSTATNSPHARSLNTVLQQLPRRIPLKVVVPVGAIVVGTVLYNTSDPFRHSVLTFQRIMRAAEAVVICGVDYKYSLGLGNRDLKEGDPADELERKKRKSALHTRSAVRVREVLKQNGGIYIKLGQHLAALGYILPEEWTRAMEPLQDRCIPSPLESIQAMFLKDLGQPISEIFSSFDPNPIGVASLAQVHRATLKDGREVAVKIQHPSLQEFASIDVWTVSSLVNSVAYFFPEFQFIWLSEEMQTSLPKELNFVFEAANADQVRANFEKVRASGEKSTIKVPDIIWAQRRVMVMEFMSGSRIDNLEYLKEHNIKVAEISIEMAKIFSQMIYKDGFIHCDPHPGNLMIRPTPPGSKSHRNFEIILLDHGLYRTITPEFRLDYAHLWTAIIQSNEEQIKYRSLKLGGTDAYELFTCILTGRDWDVVKDSQLTKTVRTKEESLLIAEGAGNRIAEIADILAKIPRDLLLLLKTNDLLRALDEDLGADDGAQMRTFAIMGKYCAQAVFEADKQQIKIRMSTERSVIRWALSMHALWKAYTAYLFVQVSMDSFMKWIDLEQKLVPFLHWVLKAVGLY